MSGWGEEVPESGDDFDIATFSSGVEKRVSVVLLVDTSLSMQGPEDAAPPRPIDELNASLSALAAELRTSRRLMHRAEIAMITFGRGGVTTLTLGDNTPYCAAGQFTPPTLEAGDVTPMLDAIAAAMRLVERRKAELDAASIMRFRPLIFLITDGRPTDPEGNVMPDDALRPLARELANLEESKKLALFAVGVSGARIEALQTLAPDGYWDLRDGNFADFMKLVSTSVGASDPISFARAQIAKARAVR